MTIHYGNDYVLIENIQEENISKCVETRRMNQTSFFGNVASDVESEKWIRMHSENLNNILLEILYKPAKCFVGTIGFVRQNEEIEIGRLSIYTPAVKELIRTGVNPEVLHKVVEMVSKLTIDYLFGCTDAKTLVCNVLANNRYSNALCAQLGGMPQKKQLEINGVFLDVLHYEMTRAEYLERG